jgi:hypothetical protein
VIRFELVPLEGSGAVGTRGRVDFTVANGEVFVIFAPERAERTALLRLLTGVVEPAKGRIFVGDVEADLALLQSEVWAPEPGRLAYEFGGGAGNVDRVRDWEDYGDPLAVVIDGGMLHPASVNAVIRLIGQLDKPIVYITHELEGLRAAAPAANHLAYFANGEFESTLPMWLQTEVDGGGLPVGSEPKAPPVSDPYARFVNLAVTPNRLGVPLPKTQSLDRDTAYSFRIDIGALDKQSIVTNATSSEFPSEALPARTDGWWLEVIGYSDDVAFDSDRHPLFLPVEGPSFVCPCEAGAEHTCSETDRLQHVWADFHTGAEDGVASVRLAIYFERNLVQSQLVSLVVGAPRSQPALASVIDYTLVPKLDRLDGLRPRALQILVNENRDGTHRVVVNGKKVVLANVMAGTAEAQMVAARNCLYGTHLEGDGDYATPTYDDTKRHSKTWAHFVNDLEQLAFRGWDLFTAIWPEADTRDSLVGALHDAAAHGDPPLVQISRMESSLLILPWQLVYEIPFVEGAPAVACQGTRDWYEHGGEAPSFICPHAEDHRQNVLCLYGFWGFAARLEVPPSISGDMLHDAVAEHAEEGRIGIAGMTSELPAATLKSHRAAIERLFPGIQPFDAKDALGNELFARPHDLIYFYCHGLREFEKDKVTEKPLLSIGAKNGGKIYPSDISAWRTTAGSATVGIRHPLVVLNGCHTTELGPRLVTDFVSAFYGSGAAGVIGTEISVDAGAAAEAMEVFLDGVSRNVEVATSMRTMRWHLARNGNVIGLAYTPYCSGHLRLRNPASN